MENKTIELIELLIKLNKENLKLIELLKEILENDEQRLDDLERDVENLKG